MSFQYYTKTKEELIESAKIISDNLAEIVGCSNDKNTWSPATAYGVCKAITMAGINCSNISNQTFKDNSSEFLTYEFNSTLNSEAYSIWSKVMKYDSSIYNLDKISDFKLNTKLSTLDKLKICVEQSKDYDSRLFENMVVDEQFIYSEDYKRLAWIILACFTIRHTIFEFSRGISETIDTEILNDSFLERVKKNIVCEKVNLSNYTGTWSSYDCSPDGFSEILSLLLFNIKQLQTFVLNYIK